MFTSGYPVEGALAPSRARPGGNVTGMTIYAGAHGLIMSNFTVNADGDVVDNHFARLYLP